MRFSNPYRLVAARTEGPDVTLTLNDAADKNMVQLVLAASLHGRRRVVIWQRSQLLYTLSVDQRSLQAGDHRTSAYGYKVPRIVCPGSNTGLTMAVGGAGTDSVESSLLGLNFS